QPRGEMQHGSDVRAAAFGPGGQSVLTATADTLQWWSTSDRQRLGPGLKRGDLGTIVALVCGRQERGATVIAAGAARMIRVWDDLILPAGRALVPGGTPVHAAAFGWDGRAILVGRGSDWGRKALGEAHLLDASSKKPLSPRLPH